MKKTRKLKSAEYRDYARLILEHAKLKREYTTLAAARETDQRLAVKRGENYTPA